MNHDYGELLQDRSGDITTGGGYSSQYQLSDAIPVLEGSPFAFPQGSVITGDTTHEATPRTTMLNNNDSPLQQSVDMMLFDNFGMPPGEPSSRNGCDVPEFDDNLTLISRLFLYGDRLNARKQGGNVHGPQALGYPAGLPSECNSLSAATTNLFGGNSSPVSNNAFTPLVSPPPHHRPSFPIEFSEVPFRGDISTDDGNGPIRVVRRSRGWVTVLRYGGRQATGPYRETVRQCVEDQKEVHRLRLERGLTNSEVMQLLEQMKVVTDPVSSTRKKPKKHDYYAPVGVRRMHKGFAASVRVNGKEVYGPLRQDVADATCDREEMMKYRLVVDAPGMRAFVKTLKERVYPHHQLGEFQLQQEVVH
ncbi:hypothetical protein Pmar_PMAR028311 [Perkinsus marinus ATCC 50983]|uniref:Uncharacterized protein n=1 Tax=Perkinsus marinus (strain ATCC 50983 / TXsc) TaxID=423536 RepID=C5LN60_PERM5|nr:hypothetical protein Pmar_PMAR028311 [Perkinsus marinus ATCC 50983]EER01859.1 hypothetical protein Pmar_PMAR028311 [Perkinsus marinus ATCC 50983]|eukprot:XP_002769141.1 hypothetical protein Pmar_PMAR028311 [Perkinsus marinus ATCC 50983]